MKLPGSTNASFLAKMYLQIFIEVSILNQIFKKVKSKLEIKKINTKYAYTGKSITEVCLKVSTNIK